MQAPDLDAAAKLLQVRHGKLGAGGAVTSNEVMGNPALALDSRNGTTTTTHKVPPMPTQVLSFGLGVYQMASHYHSTKLRSILQRQGGQCGIS